MSQSKPITTKRLRKGDNTGSARTAIDNPRLYRQPRREIDERKQTEHALARRAAEQSALFQFTARQNRATTLPEVYDAALDAILGALDCQRASILIFDESGVMRFVGWRGLSEGYRKAVEGHSPWKRDEKDPQPVCIDDLSVADIPESLKRVVNSEGIRALAFIPLVVSGQLLGKFMAYHDAPHAFTEDEVNLGLTLARQLGFAIEQKRAQEAVRRRGERLQLLSEMLGQLLSARDPETIVHELFPKVAAHLGVDTYFNFMVNEEGTALKLHSCAGIPQETAKAIGELPFGEAICGIVAQTLQPIHATDIQNSDCDKAALIRGFGIQCHACNPLRAGKRLLGTLSFASRTRKAFDDDELQFLRIISQYTAVAIDRLQSTEALKQSEERFRAMLDNSSTLIFMKDSSGRYMMVNKEYERLFGNKPGGIIGKSDFDLFPADIAQKYHDNDLQVVRTGKPLETEEPAMQADGPHTYLSVKFPLRRKNGTIYAITGISTDITERKRAEVADRLLGAIVESSDDAIVSKDLNGIVQSWNKGAERVFGYMAADMVGKSITMLIPPDRLSEEDGILQRIRSGETIDHYETVRRRKDGTLIDVSLTVSPIKDSRGKVVGASKVARDITGKVRAKEQLEQAVAERTASLHEALAQMEEFSYSVSHDLRAPLRAMTAYATVLMEDYGAALDGTARGYIEKIQRSSDRMHRLTQDVLTYSRVARTQVQPEPIALDRLVKDVIHQYTNLQEPAADIQISSPLLDVMGHETSLGQCVANVLNNAVKFVAPGVKPRVRIWTERAGKNVRAFFQDNGIGIKREHQGRIFQMFERVHPEGKYEGTGIGLTIARKAVEKMGGRMGVDSDGAHGSRFWIELPGAEGVR